MKIRITHASKSSYWYADKVGAIFEVVGEDAEWYTVQYKDNFSDFHANKNDCEAVKETAKLVKVIKATLSTYWYAEYIGQIFEVSMEDSDGCYVHHKGDFYVYHMQTEDYVVINSELMTLKEALKAAIDGAKVKPSCKYTKGYLYFNGVEFMWYNAYLKNSESAKSIMENTEWQMYIELQPEPKFDIDELVVDGDGFYAKVKSRKYRDKQWNYETVCCPGDDDTESYDEDELSKV